MVLSESVLHTGSYYLPVGPAHWLLRESHWSGGDSLLRLGASLSPEGLHCRLIPERASAVSLVSHDARTELPSGQQPISLGTL